MKRLPTLLNVLYSTVKTTLNHLGELYSPMKSPPTLLDVLYSTMKA
ncbi:MAG: hypothetical protein ACTTK2_02865 [Hoylesella marshii]